MNKKSLWFITVLMIIALIGVFIMQVYYIRQAYRLNSQIFDQKVYKAMSDVAVQVQKRNARKHIEKKTQEVEEQKESNIRGQTDKIVSFKEAFRQNEDIRRFQQQQTTINYLNFQISKIKENFITPLSISEEEYKEFYNTDKDVVKGLRLIVNQSVDKSGRPILELYPTNLRRLQPFYGSIPDTIRYIAISPEDGSPRFVSLATSDKDLQTKFKIEDANAQQKYQLELNRLYADTTVISRVSQDFLEDVQKEMQLTDLPLSKRISKPVLDALLKKELQNQGINTNYKFWLSTSEKDSVIFENYKTKVPIPGNAHSIILFNNDLNKDPGKLYVSFPDQSAAIYRDMGITLSSSFGFLLLLVFIFAYTIYSIIRQKKISEMKSDFINNMTHEFKTPVATIMLASEALKDPEALNDTSRVQRLAGIIYDENIRLGNHIERVLSIAKIENRELHLEEALINLNDVITGVTESMDLQLKKKNAVVTLNLNATEPMIVSDELHLSNVIFNLVDNANKYSKDEPRITITTRNTARKLIFEVADEGIGMTKDQTKRIFDQFYRVPTGNLHDVKGFGLGLNYVQDILDQLGGTIKVNSEKDKGTIFEVSFPLTKNS